MLSDDDPATLARHLTELREEHRDLDTAIAKLVLDPACNQLQLSRQKKRKLKQGHDCLFREQVDSRPGRLRA
jgi:hypothetical protein